MKTMHHNSQMTPPENSGVAPYATLYAQYKTPIYLTHIFQPHAIQFPPKVPPINPH